MSRVDDAVRELTEAIVEASPPTISGVEVETAITRLVGTIGEEAGKRLGQLDPLAPERSERGT